MILYGNTVGTTARQPDYAQTDETRADFIRNKPDAAIARAQATADSGKATAEAALARSGGTMTGSVSMGGNAINMGGGAVTGLAEPTESSHGATKGYVDDKRKIFTAALAASGWGTEVPYVQTVAVDVTENDAPHIGLIPDDDISVAVTQEEAWGCVSRGVSGAGTIRFYCYEERPEVDLQIQIEVNR